MKFWLSVVLLCSSISGFAIDREAFTITNYDLNVRVEPDQQRLGARGKITLRNDSAQPQKIAVLQVSSSLDWRSITAGGTALTYVTQPYTSDIDHTGALSEAVITLPQPIAPKATIELEIAYEGVIAQDATRLTRIGAPEDTANGTDWDQISPKFTAVRGVGYVAWYPIATEMANLSEQNSLFEELSRWKARESGARVQIVLESPETNLDGSSQVALCNGEGTHTTTKAGFSQSTCLYTVLGSSVPAFVVGPYKMVDRPAISVDYLPGDEAAASAYADAAQTAMPLISDWFGNPHTKAITAELPNNDAAPFESGSLLLTPLNNADSQLAGLAAAHQLAHAAFRSPRPWINEGLAHFAQALYLEQQKGRAAALDYMGLHRSVFVDLEKQAGSLGFDSSGRSLVATVSEELYRSKAMYVWWMLRDMLGASVVKKAIAEYRPEQDKDPSYLPRLIQAQTQRDLEWFFDDWVYRDRGLPDFKVESAFSRKMLNGSYMLTVTVDNLGGAEAEVPVIVKFAGGDMSKRLEVRAKSKAVIRIETTGVPQEVTLNDGSVPETDTSNNTFKVGASEGTQ